MATHSGTLAWKIPWTEEPGGQRPWGCKELDTQRSLMAAVHGAAESDTTEPLHFLSFCGAGSSLVAQLVKSLPAMQETWVWSLGQKGPLEKEMATHSGTLAWKIPWTEEPGRLLSMGSRRVGHDWATSLSLQARRRRFIFKPRLRHLLIIIREMNTFFQITIL